MRVFPFPFDDHACPLCPTEMNYRICKATTRLYPCFYYAHSFVRVRWLRRWWLRHRTRPAETRIPYWRDGA